MYTQIAITLPVSFSCDSLSLWTQVRQEVGPLNGLLEFPGGKLQRGELSSVAAKREFLEEVGISLSEINIELFSMFSYEYPDRKLLFFIYYFDIEQLPKLKELLIEQKITFENAQNDVKNAYIPNANKAFLMQFIEFHARQLGV